MKCRITIRDKPFSAKGKWYTGYIQTITFFGLFKHWEYVYQGDSLDRVRNELIDKYSPESIHVEFDL